MKARMKLAIGAAFAAVAVMAATQPAPAPSKKELQAPCYTAAEVDLLMRANSWSKQEATTILDMACKFSSQE